MVSNSFPSAPFIFIDQTSVSLSLNSWTIDMESGLPVWQSVDVIWVVSVLPLRVPSPTERAGFMLPIHVTTYFFLMGSKPIDSRPRIGISLELTFHSETAQKSPNMRACSVPRTSVHGASGAWRRLIRESHV